MLVAGRDRMGRHICDLDKVRFENVFGLSARKTRLMVVDGLCYIDVFQANHSPSGSWGSGDGVCPGSDKSCSQAGTTKIDR